MPFQTFKVRFILKKEKTNQKGLAPIFARIRINGIKVELSSNRMICKENWCGKTETAFPISKSNKEINSFLENFKSKIYAAYSQLLSTGQEIDASLLKETIYGKPVKKKYCLIETFREHNDQFESQIGKKYSYGSYKNYKTTLKYLIEFIPLVYNKGDIPLDSVDYKFCENYYAFLTSKKPCNNNGANKHIQRVRKIIHSSIKLGYLKLNPMASFNLQFKPTNRIALTMQEINGLHSLAFQGKRLEEVRDIFLYQCYTGLSYGDIKTLQWHDVHTQEGDELWIKMERQKTGIQFSVPLLRIAVEIMMKYRTTPNASGPIFPVLSNQKMNQNLKVLQELAGINKNLTTHLARHSFATTITLNNGVPIETVSKMLGHTNLRTTQVYAKVLDAKIGADMKRLEGKL